MKLLEKQKPSAKAGGTRHLTPKVTAGNAANTDSCTSINGKQFSPETMSKLVSLSNWMNTMKMRPADLLNDRGLNFSYTDRMNNLSGQSNDEEMFKGDQSFDAVELVGLWKRVGDPLDEDA